MISNRLSGGGRRQGRLGKEIAADAFINCIHSGLQSVEEFVEAGFDNGVYLSVIEFGTKQPGAAFGGAGKGSRSGPGYGVPAYPGSPVVPSPSISFSRPNGVEKLAAPCVFMITQRW